MLYTARTRDNISACFIVQSVYSMFLFFSLSKRPSLPTVTTTAPPSDYRHHGCVARGGEEGRTTNFEIGFNYGCSARVGFVIRRAARKRYIISNIIMIVHNISTCRSNKSYTHERGNTRVIWLQVYNIIFNYTRGGTPVVIFNYTRMNNVSR